MIRIITDSVSSVSADEAKKLGVEVVSLFVHHEGREFEDATMDLDAFYENIYDMKDNIPTSSQPSASAFEEVFEQAAAAGDEVLGIFISVRMSGTHDNALRAARSVAARHVGFKFRIVDTASCGFDEGMIVRAAASARAAGKTLDECAKAAEDAIVRTRFLFTPESLVFLQKGGRIGNAAAFIGSLIQLSPVLSVRDGMTCTYAKVRTQKRALNKMVAVLKQDIEAHGLCDIVVHYIGSKVPAVEWAREAIEPVVGRAVEVLPVSPVIGLHVGPSVGMVYRCNNAIDGKITASRSFVIGA